MGYLEPQGNFQMDMLLQRNFVVAPAGVPSRFNELPIELVSISWFWIPESRYPIIKELGLVYIEVFIK